jgi:acyl-[acyl-carrier-protein]-phospholipid O-acyltransferase/long-chain-fatty-acid--[acyl-carrier-protein] ligase
MREHSPAMQVDIPASGWRRGFWSLMATQFQTAFSDNALKNLIILLVLGSAMPQEQRNSHVAMAGALFAAPFILFSMLGGWLADRFSKQQVMSAVKLAEIGIMLFAAMALAWRQTSLELAAIFLMGCHSAIFAPSKYGILPELLPHDRLSWGNGILELLTFLGIIFGIAASGLLAETFAGSQGLSGLILALLALCGWWLSRSITPVPAANPACAMRINPVTDLWARLMIMKQDRDLWRANWGNAGFFFVAALVQMNLMIYAQDVLRLSQSRNAYLNLALALGIGFGSVAAGYASRGRIEYRLVPLGAVGLALCSIPMGIGGVSFTTFVLCLVGLGFSAGLFIVPIAAVLQHRPAPEDKGAVQGAANVLSFIGILAASGVQWLSFRTLNLTPGQVFWVCGACALLTGAYSAISRGRFIRAE